MSNPIKFEDLDQITARDIFDSARNGDLTVIVPDVPSPKLAIISAQAPAANDAVREDLDGSETPSADVRANIANAAFHGISYEVEMTSRATQEVETIHIKSTELKVA